MASEDSKTKVGKGWHKNKEEHAIAGRKGGQTTSERYGSDFYSQIGRRGGKKSPGNFRNNPERAREAGRRGGEAKKKNMKLTVLLLRRSW